MKQVQWTAESGRKTMEWPVQEISYGSLSAVNAARKAAGEDPMVTVRYICISPNGSRRVVHDYDTVDNEPQIITKRRAANWRIQRWVLAQCGIDTLNPQGWGGYACIDEWFICRNPEETLAEHRMLCAK
jgi:hypothetical protein